MGEIIHTCLRHLYDNKRTPFMTTKSNFFQNNLFYLVPGFLIFLVLSSKNILIYNEELLIALSFVGFVVFSSHTMGETCAEAFQARSQAIQGELQTYFTMKEDVLLELIQKYKKRLALAESLNILGQISTTEITTLYTQREQALQSTVTSQMHQKLKTLGYTEKTLQDTLQTLCIQGFRESVLEEFQRGKKQLGPKLLQQALTALQKSGK